MRRNLPFVIICLYLLLPSSVFAVVGDVPTTGLIGHWTFEEGSGTTTADSSGNGNDGTLVNGPTWTTGVAGDSALELDGVDDYMSASTLDGVAFSANGSLSFWINGSFSVDGNKSIFDRFDTTRNHLFARTYLPANGIQVAFQKGDGSGYVFNSNTAISIATSTWTHIGIAWDTTNNYGYVYKNGELAYSDSIASTTWTPSGQIVRFGNVNNTFGGLLDDIALYNRVLSADEMDYIYSGSGDLPPPNLPCDDFVVEEDNTYSNMSDVQCALSAATPGDTIKIASGSYSDVSLIASSNGASGNRITLMPASADGVIFTGYSTITVNGDYVTIEGIRFENTGAAPSESSVGFQTPAVSIGGDHVTITGMTFLNASGGDNFHYRIVRIKNTADDAEIASSTFTGSKNVSIGLINAQDASDEVAERTWIHDNTFSNISIDTPNGGETIQLGSGTYPAQVTAAIIEQNTISNVDADSEIISVKTSGNTIRNNTVSDNTGEIVLRQGDDSTVTSNLLLRNTGGIRVSGSGHTITNNVVINPTSRALYLTYGSTNYPVATGNTIANNTFVSARDAIYVLNPSPTDDEIANPNTMTPITDNTIVNNIFEFATSTQTIFTISPGPQTLQNIFDTNTFSHNIFWNTDTTLETVAALSTDSDFNYFTNPLIADVSNGDYYLLAASPAINAGTDSLCPDTDILGESRANGCDIGAYEGELVPDDDDSGSSGGSNGGGGGIATRVSLSDDDNDEETATSTDLTTEETATSTDLTTEEAQQKLEELRAKLARLLELRAELARLLELRNATSYTFLSDLKLHDTNLDVQKLQQYLNRNGFVLIPTGSGSPGNETQYFGSLTYNALVRFQNAHAAEILTPVGLTTGSGYFGPSTRAYVNSH